MVCDKDSRLDFLTHDFPVVTVTFSEMILSTLNGSATFISSSASTSFPYLKFLIKKTYFLDAYKIFE